MGLGGKALALGMFVALTSTAGCLQSPTPQSPETKPASVSPVLRPQASEPSEESQQLAVYYRRLQNDLLVQGLLRGDGGGPDTQFTDTQLARNFVRVALFNEYRDDSDLQATEISVSKLRRWDQPVHMQIGFGDTVPYAQRDQDVMSVQSYAARLSRLTGVPISFDQPDPNFHVLFLGEDDRRAMGPLLTELAPPMSQITRNAIINMSRDQYCLVVAFIEQPKQSYSKAIAIIRAEHPNLMRTACIHEELAQGMGLANDSLQARPSIFNDDEEFALLTTHDELLLRILYDPRLETGMDPATAAPIARTIARELMAPNVPQT